jgi:hypothetical protein
MTAVDPRIMGVLIEVSDNGGRLTADPYVETEAVWQGYLRRVPARYRGAGGLKLTSKGHAALRESA